MRGIGTAAALSETITVCICTYNRYDALPRAIESAAKQTLSNYEILVVDNSSDSVRALAFGKRFLTIGNLRYVVERTPGLSNARNVAADVSKSEFIAFMDDDAVAGPCWAEELLRTFREFGPSTAIVGGRVDPLWAAARPPWLHDAMLGNLSVVNWGGEARVAGPKEWFAGTNVAFRRSAILDYGGFSTNLGRVGSGASLLSNEEVHLLERIRAGGGKIVYAPKAVVEHIVEINRLTRTWFRKRSAWQAVSDFMMDSDGASAAAKDHWPKLREYFNVLPPHERTIRGLLYDTEDPDLFLLQTGSIYLLTLMTLAGFDGVELG